MDVRNKQSGGTGKCELKYQKNIKLLMLKCLYNSSQINDEDRLILINSWHHSCKNVKEKEIFTDVARKFREENYKNFCYDP